MTAAADALCSPDDLIVLFNSCFSEILDLVASLKYKHPNFKSKVRLDDHTRSLRQSCRRAERRWKKDCLTVSFQIFKAALSSFEAAAKEASARYFSDIINRHSNRPKILFNTINSIINPPFSTALITNSDISENFLHFFTKRKTREHQSFVPSLCSSSSYTPIPYSHFLPFQSCLFGRFKGHRPSYEIYLIPR